MSSFEPDDTNGGGGEAQMGLETAAEQLESSGGAWAIVVAIGALWWCVDDMKRWFDGFFLDEGPGMGGESQKGDLRARLADFQILENHGWYRLFGLDFWYFWVFLVFEILGMDR